MVSLKSQQKINALSRVTPVMNLSNKKMLMNSFFKSQFSYCPLAWMSHSRTINNKINHSHERCLRVIYNDKISSFKELLERDGSVLFQNTIGIFRSLRLKCSKFITIQLHRYLLRFFNKRNTNYQLQHTSHFSVPPVRSVYNVTESLSFLGLRIWDIAPTELKEVKPLSAFKSRIKTWWPQNCPCRLCKRYLPNIGNLGLFHDWWQQKIVHA